MSDSIKQWEREAEAYQRRADERRSRPRDPDWWVPWLIVLFLLAAWGVIVIAVEAVAKYAP